MDKLTIEEVDLFYNDVGKNESELLLAGQLLDTMREVERLREALKELVDLKRIKEAGPYADVLNHDYARRKPLAWKAAFDLVDNSSKPIDTGLTAEMCVAALKDAAQVALKRAIETNTMLVIWDGEKIVEHDPTQNIEHGKDCYCGKCYVEFKNKTKTSGGNNV